MSDMVPAIARCHRWLPDRLLGVPLPGRNIRAIKGQEVSQGLIAVLPGAAMAPPWVLQKATFFRIEASGTARTSLTVWLTIGVIRVLSRKGGIGLNFPLHFLVFPFISIELGENKMKPSFPWG
jgi:hypothetical protein